MAAVKQGKDEVVYVSSGEGTTSVIQNNKYAISVHVSEQMTRQSVYRFTADYEGLTPYKVDDTDFFTSFRVMKEAV